jgi:hypothetical protein
VAVTALWLAGNVRSLCIIGTALDTAPHTPLRPFPRRPDEHFNPDNTQHAHGARREQVPGRVSRPHARCDPPHWGHASATEVAQPLIRV